MKKRLLITFLAIALILGALGINAMAGTEETPVTKAATASFVQTPPALDGETKEQSWLMSSVTKGAAGTPAGRFGKLWKGTDLYLAVDTAGATAMSLNLNGKTAAVDLTGASPAVSGMDNVQAVKKGNVVEMKIPFASFSFVLGNYGQTIPMELSLTNATGTSSYSGNLEFTAQEVLETQGAITNKEFANPITAYYGSYNAAAKANGQVGNESIQNADGSYTYHLWNIYQQGKTNYPVQGIYARTDSHVLNALKNSGLLTVDFDLQIDDMPEYTNPTSGLNIWRTYDPAGLAFNIGRNIKDENIKLSFTNLKDVGLVLYVGHGPLLSASAYGSSSVDAIQWDGPYKLHQELGEKFHVTVYYRENGEIAVYANDTEVFPWKDMGTDFVKGGSNPVAALNFTLWSPFYHPTASKVVPGIADILSTNSAPKNSGANADVYVSNLKVGQVSCEDLIDTLTFDTIKGSNTDPQFITSDLTLPTTLTDGKLTANLEWVSSHPEVIGNDGKFTAPDAFTDVALTAKVPGTNISKTFNLKVVMPVMDAWRADSVTVDGNLTEYHDFTRGYAFATEAGKPSGKIAARWDDKNLYLGAEFTDAAILAFQLNEKVIVADLVNKTVDLEGAVIAVADGKAEIALPLSALGLSGIEDGTAKALGVILANDQEVGMKLLLNFFGAAKNGYISWGGNINVDGKVNEGTWKMYYTLAGRTGAPEGKFDQAWNGTDLYLAINTADAKALSLKLCGKTANIDLTAATLTDSTGLITNIAKQGNLVELKIPFGAFYNLYNYGQTMPVELELTNEFGTSGFYGTLEFTGRENLSTEDALYSSTITNAWTGTGIYAPFDTNAITTGQVGIKDIANEDGSHSVRLWNIYQEGEPNYNVQGIYGYTDPAFADALKQSGLLTLDFDVQIDDMPEYTDPTSGNMIFRKYDPAGLAFSICRNIAGENIKLSFTNVKDVGLSLYVGHGPLTSTYGSGTIQWNGPHKIGKELGEKFHVTVLYHEDGRIAVYADDEEIFALKDMGTDFDGSGSARALFCYNLWSAYYNPNDAKRPAGLDEMLDTTGAPKNDKANADVTVGNFKIGRIACEDLLDLLTFDTIKGLNGSESTVVRDLELPTVITDGKLSTGLTWKSSDENVVATDGKVTTQDKNTRVTISAELTGSSPVQKKSFNLMVNTPVMDAWYGKEDHFDRGYTFPAVAGKPSGEVSARWDDKNLYLTANTQDATKFVVIVGGKTYTADVANDKAEIVVPLSAIGTIEKNFSTPASLSLTGNGGSVSKSVALCFFGVPSLRNASWHDAKITVDGKLTEGDWKIYSQFIGRPGSPAGAVGALWNGTDLYLAVQTGDATKLNIKLNGKTATIDLATLAVAGMNNVTVKKNGSDVELKIPFASFDFALQNYTQTVPFTVEIENAAGVSGYEGPLGFSSLEHKASGGVSSQEITNIVPNMYGGITTDQMKADIIAARNSGQIGNDAMVDAYGNTVFHMWNKYQEGVKNYAVQGIYSRTNVGNSLKEMNGIIAAEFDLQIDEMPVYNEPQRGDQVWRTLEPAGLGITMYRGLVGKDLKMGISNTADGLVMYIGYSTNKDYGSGSIVWDGPHKLGVQMGQKFHMALQYTADGELAVLIDDEVIYEFKNVGFDFGGQGKAPGAGLNFTLWTPYYNAALNADILNPDSSIKNAGANTDLYVSNVKVGEITCYDLMDSLTFDVIRGQNGSENSVMKDLTLPATLSDGNKLTANLTWKSSDTSVIANSGKVTTGTKDTPVKVTATLTGTSISKSFEVVVALPAVDAWRADSVNVNGTLAEYYDFTRGYTFAPEAGMPDGSFGVRWNKNTLYIGAEFNNADKLTVTVGGKTIVADLAAKKVSGVNGASIAVGEGTVELGVPMSSLSLGTITEGVNKPVTVAFSKGAVKVQKSLGLHFYGVQITRNVQWNDGTIAIDGVLEGDWMMYADFNGRKGSPVGGFAKMWNGSDLFLAIDAGDADKLFVTVCGRSTMVDLTADPLTDTAGLAQAIAKQGSIVEMKISFKDFFTLSNYGQTIPVAVEVENEVASSGVHMNLAFSSQEYEESANSVWSQTTTTVVPNVYGGISDELNAERIKQAIKNGQAGEKTTVDEHGNATYHMWNIFQEGKDNYAVQGVYTYLNNEAVNEALTSIEGTMSVDFDLKIDDMPEYIEPWRGDQIWRTFEPAGLGINISRGIVGENVKLGISNTKEGLVLYVGYGPTTKTYGSGTVQWDGPHKLGVKMGEKFHVSVHYTEKGEVAVFVNDSEVYKLKEVGYDFGGKGTSTPSLGFTLWTPYYNEELNAHILNPDSTPKNSAYSTDLYVSNVKLGNVTAYDIFDNLSFDDIRGTNGSEDTLVSKLTLPGKLSDGKISTTLKWTSSNTRALSSSGVVTSQDVRTPVTLTATLAGTNITKKFNLTVTLPYLDAWQGNFVKVDGELSEYFGLDRGYTFPKVSGKPSGSVAALWNLEKDRLYFAVKHNNATKMKITLGSRTIDVDIAKQTVTGGGGLKNVQMKTGKDTLEISLPLSRLRVNEIKIGDFIDITVQMANEKTSVYKNLQLCFYGAPGYAQVAWNKGDVVIDGKIDEPDWQTYTQIQGRSGAPIGTFGELWNGTNLYLAVNTDGAKTMNLTLNGKSATIDLTKLTVKGMKNVKIAKDGDSVELKIPFDSIGLNLRNYTQTIEMRLELSNSVGTSGFVGQMYFSSRQYNTNVVGEPQQSAHNNVEVYYGTADNVDNAFKSGQIGYTTEKDANGNNTIHMWNIYQEGQKNYPVQFIQTSLTHLAEESLKSIKGTLTLDFDLQIDDMPEYIEPTNGNQFWRQYAPPGLSVGLGRDILNEEAILAFTNELEQGLVMYVGTGPFTRTYGSDTVQWHGPFKLNKELGQKFHVSVHHTDEGEVAVYIDDYLLYEFSDRGANFPAAAQLGLTFTTNYPFYYTELSDKIVDKSSAPMNSDFDSDVYVSNVQLGTADCYDLMDLLDFDVMKKNNGSVNTVNTDLNLPTKLSDGKITTGLVWESKKEDVISTTGKVTTGKKDTNVILKATLKDAEPLQYEEYELTVILPYMDAWYGSAVADGKVSEYHDFDRGYTFVKEKGKPTGSVAARWDDKNLYLAGKFENADSLTIEVGKKSLKADLVNKTVDMKEAQIAVGKGTVEIIIPRDKLGIDDLATGDHADMLVGFHKGDVTNEKWVRMTFYGGYNAGFVGWGGEKITVDGQLTETAWQLYGKPLGREGTPEGLVGKMWSGDSLYLAVYTADAHTMILTVNGKSTTIKLSSPRDTTGLISKMAKGAYTYYDVIPDLLNEDNTPEHIKVNGSVLEMQIPFKNFGFELYNYGLTTDVSVELISNAGASSYAATLEYTNTNWKNYLVKLTTEDKMNSQLSDYSTMLDRGVTIGQVGFGQTELETGRFSYRMWNRYVQGAIACPNMWMTSASSAGSPYADMHHPEDTFQMDCDIRIDDMAEYPDVAHYIASYGVDGITFSLNRGAKDRELQFGISNLTREPKTGHKGFVLSAYHIPSGEWIVTPIYIEKYETFHLTAKINTNGDLTVYIDDQFVATYEGAAGSFDPRTDWPEDRFAVWMNDSDQTYSTMPSAFYNNDVTISNVTVGTVDDESIMDYLVFEDFMAPNRRDNAVWQDMKLPATVSDGMIASKLVWTSSNENAIKIENGVAKVNPQDKDTEVTLTASLAGDPKVTKAFKIIVTPQIVDAGIDKYVNAGTMAGGSVQAKWNKEAITFSIAHNGADSVNLTVGEKQAEVILSTTAVAGIEGAKADVKGNTVEVTLPRKALGIEIKEYHQTNDFTVETVKGGKTLATKNFKVEFVGYESIIEEYQKSKALSDFAASIKTVTDHVAIPTTYQSAYLDASANLTWESDTPKVLSNEGKLNAPEKVGLNVKLTYFVNGTEAGNVTGHVKALGMPDVQSTTRVQAAFVDKVKIDGAITEQWSLNNAIAKGDKVIGKMGAMWDTEYLYLAFQTGSAKTLTLEIEGKTAQINLGGKPTGDLKIADMAKNGKYLELKIAMKDIGLGKIEDYGDELKTAIMLDEGKFEGTLVLSSIQYFITDKPNNRLVMSSSDPVEKDNVGWKETSDGYNLYATYAPGGENLAAQTMGVGFNHTTKAGTEIYEPLGDSGVKGLYVEFDFQANYLPAYTGEEDIQGSHINLGTNGFNWGITGSIENKDMQAEWLQGGIFNNGDRLILVHRFARYEFDKIPLDKGLGDKFRIGIAWNADDSLDFYIDGERIYHTDKTCHYTGAPSSKKSGVAFRLQRSADAAARDYDGMDVNIENLAMGNFYGECLIENMDFETIRDKNINEYAIVEDLNLMEKYAGEQITTGKLTWTSSDESVITNTGKVTRPEVGYEAVDLTVTNELGHSEDMTVIVKGLAMVDDVLHVSRDYNPAGLSGVPMIEGAFALDKDSESIIKDQKEAKKVNVITLTELDEYGRLYRDMLTLWVSDDNVTYTEIKDFKLLHKDNKWYIYDFEAEARYIKVHCTHFDTYEYDVIGVSSDMIDVYYEDQFGAGGEKFATSKTVTVKNSSKNNRIDWTWEFTPQELGIVSLTDDLADIRIMQGSNYLYHYVEDGMVYVRIPEIKAGGKAKIKVLSGNKDAMDISNKDNVLEILYGTKEFYTDYNYNWTGYTDEYLPFSTMVTTNDGTIINTAISRAQEGYCREQVYSKDGGRTWQGLKTLDEFDPIAHPGGFVHDSVKDVVWAWGYKTVKTENGEAMIMHILKMDMAPGIENAQWEYVCEFAPELEKNSYPELARYQNYNNGIMLSCYDGEGPNVDMLIPFHSGEGDDNAIAGARTLYTDDAGATWKVSDGFTSYANALDDVTLGFEYGISESCIQELEGGTVIKVSRNQRNDSVSFAYSYSTDYGRTWTEEPIQSQVWAPNTQPMFNESYDDKVDVLLWAGNNLMGGDSYWRQPVVLAQFDASPENCGVMGVQYPYNHTYMQAQLENVTRSTNIHDTRTLDGDLIFFLGEGGRQPGNAGVVRINNIHDYMTKTKGSYDSFENDSVKYEGWSVVKGMSSIDYEKATHGEASMKTYGMVVRGVTSFSYGSVSADLYWNEGKRIQFELATAHIDEEDTAAAAKFTVNHDGSVSVDGVDTGLKFVDGWNSFNLAVDLPKGIANLTVNGSEPAALAVNTEYGEYVAYIRIHSDAFVWVDNVAQIGEEDILVQDKTGFLPVEEDSNTALTVALAIGIPALVIVAIVVAVIFSKKKLGVTKNSQDTEPNN
jgi:hypothetical protein